MEYTTHDSCTIVYKCFPIGSKLIELYSFGTITGLKYKFAVIIQLDDSLDTKPEKHWKSIKTKYS